MIQLLARAIIAIAVVVSPCVVAAKPVTDCPNRDAPFSANSPMLDLLLSPAAVAVLSKAAPGRFSGPSPSSTAPNFLAVMTLKEAARFTGMKPEQFPAIDAELRLLPVTAADRAARCARYDNDVPKFNLPSGKPRILLFEKITGFKDAPSLAAAHSAFEAMAERKGWAIVSTESAGAFNARTLRQFDAVIWNNVSGDVLTLSQRAAFQRWISKGGAFVAVHGSAGDPVYFWDWYADTLIGARFAGHPTSPQFQEALIAVNRDHPLAVALPPEWRIKDEWYSFRTNPRAAGANVILTLDESTYTRSGLMADVLTMGADHPLAWTNCVGKGRMFYSAIGHLPETYSDQNYLTLLENGIGWAIAVKGDCPKRS